MNGLRGRVITSLYDTAPSAPSMAIQWEDMPYVYEMSVNISVLSK